MRFEKSIDIDGPQQRVWAVTGRFYRGLTDNYMTREAEGMKRAAESGLRT